MIKRAGRKVGGFVLVFGLFFATVLFSYFNTSKFVIAASFGVGIEGCDITNRGGTDYYNNSNSSWGTTGVLTKIRNATNSGENGAWLDVTYAKPGDLIQWDHCFFPGEQRLMGNYITTTHNNSGHSGSLSSAPSSNPVIYSVINTSLSTLTSRELESNNTFIDAMDGQGRPNNGPYTYTPNFARVTNLEGYYGGHRGEIGDDTIRHTTNGWRVGDTNKHFIKAVDWHVGDDYWEVQKLVFNNVAWVTQDEPAGKEWRCTYTHTVQDPIYGDNRLNDEYEGTCWHWEQNGTQCSVAIRPVCTNSYVATDPCTCSGGRQVPKMVKKLNQLRICYVSRTQEDRYTCKHDNAVYSFHTSNNDSVKESKAQLIIPWNYTVSAGDDFKIDGDYVYAGETATLKNAVVKVGPRTNSITNGTYATAIPYLEAQLKTYISYDAEGRSVSDKGYRVGASIEKDYTEGNDRTGYGLTLQQSDFSFNLNSVNVDDEEAGNYFCVVLRYFPTNSGSETNTTNKKGNETWGESRPSCKPIAKRPTFQVWGGSVFSNGKISGTRTDKNNLKGVNEWGYQVSGTSKGHVYSSWSEYGVMANGVNTYLASANAFGNKFGIYEESPKNGLCQFESFLTFANFDSRNGNTICNNTIKKQNGSFGGSIASINKVALLDDIIQYDGFEKLTVASITVGQPGTFTPYVTPNEKLVRYTYAKNKLTINESTLVKGQIADVISGSVNSVPVGTTYIVRSDNDIIIAGNLYSEPEPNTNMDDLSKLIIYGKNIEIMCQVKRVDAILIAENVINTCTNADGQTPDLNDSVRSIPLRINGAVVADKLLLNRTFGASAGYTRTENGIVQGTGAPAEVINYDTTLLIWGRAQADTASSGKVNVTYTRELAPRY